MKTFAKLLVLSFVFFTTVASGQQIHIKARFVKVPKAQHGDLQLGTIITNGAGSLRASFWQCVGDITNAVSVAPEPSGWMCILTRARLFEVLKKLQSRNKGIEALAEPEVTTLSGSQTQMRATQIRLLDTNYVHPFEISASLSPKPLPQRVETGPILDLVPNALSDGFTVNLAAIPSFTELMSSVQITNTLLIHTDSDVRVAGAKFLTTIRGWQVAANVNLWDGQTVVIGGLPALSTVSNGKPDEMELLVFITVTIVDPAGNRVHTDNDLPFAQKAVPPQPVQPIK